MANLDAAFGLRPYNVGGHGYSTSGATTYKLQTASTAGSSSNIYEGSPVIPLATGLINIVGAAAGGTVALLGVFAGCNYVDLTGTPRWSAYWPGTAAAESGSVAEAYVWDDPNQLFTINCNAAAADSTIFANANFVAGTSGSTTSGRSSAELAVSTVAATAALNMRIVGYMDPPNSSDATAAGRIAIVRLNNHFYNQPVNTGPSVGI